MDGATIVHWFRSSSTCSGNIPRQMIREIVEKEQKGAQRQFIGWLAP